MASKITPLPPVRLQLTEASLCGWLGQAAPGDTLTYHRGSLPHDRTPHTSRLSDSDRAELGRITSRTVWAFEQGLVHLLQRRHGDEDYSYYLIARPRSSKVAASLTTLLVAEAA